ncbi:MAG: thioredoxin fold domain-containing protein [Candidatus Aminicenantes bacterium]|nr:thioredoxin fold domain-containing protein [Candidatus Aminicenantes bacterium]
MSSSEKAKISCLNCGATNNYPLVSKGKKVVCGRCRSPLPIPGEVLGLSPDQVAGLIQNSSLPLLFDFYSPTCPPCHMMHPVVEGLARRRAGEIMVIRLNVDESPEFAAHFGIQGVPTFIVFFKGYERGRSSGAMSETDFSLWVASKI